MPYKKVIINGEEVTKATTQGEINQAMKKAISELCVNQRATKVVIVYDFGIIPFMCNKYLFPYYGYITKKYYKKKPINPHVNRFYVNKPSQRIEKPYSHYTKKRFSKSPHKYKKRG